MKKIINFYKNNSYVINPTIFIVLTIVVFFVLAIALGHSIGIVGKYYGAHDDVEISLYLGIFNKGQYTIVQEGVKTSYPCTWHNRMVHPQNDEQTKYVRTDGVFSTIDIRFKAGDYESQRQFYYFNSSLISYWDEEMVLGKV